MSLVSS